MKGVSPQAFEILRRRPLNKSPNEPRTIAIDIRAICAEKTGKEWFTLNVVETLSTIDHTNRYILYTRHRFDSSWLPPNFTFKLKRLPLILWHPWMLYDMRRQNVDILLATASYIAPSLCFFRRPKPIVIIHDAVAFLFPRKHQLKARIVEKYTVGLALKHAEAIIAVSEHTKRDIVRLFNLKPEQVHVTSEAARGNFHVISDREVIRRAREKYHLPEKYILFVGTLEPRKNLSTLLKAYASLPERATHKLVIAGKKGWYYAEIFKTINTLKLNADVIVTGYVDDKDLPAILSGADVFVMPSLYEGFGLPLLEAFACGTPVVTSDTSALREIASGICLMADPLNSDELRSAIHLALTDAATREKMIAKGLTKASEFSWKKTAEELLKIINGIGTR